MKDKRTGVSSRNKSKDIALAAIALSTIASFVVTFFALSAGITAVFQNIYYIPIVLSSYHYEKRGFFFSGFLSLAYFISIVSSTLNQTIALQALIRVVVFMSVSAIIAYLSVQRNRERKLLSIGNEILGVIASSLDCHEMIEKFLEKLIALLDVRAAAMIRLDPKTQEPVNIVQRWFGLSDEVYQERLRSAWPTLKGIISEVTTSARRIDDGFLGINENAGSVYAFPVICEVTPVGVLLVCKSDRGELKDDERILLETACNAISGPLMKDLVQEELVRTRMQREGILEQLQKVNDELKETQEETNLYLDIMVHDINNANTAALGYGEILTEMLQGQEKEMARKMLIAVKQSTEIIKNVSTIRKLRESKQLLQPVELETVIRNQMDHYPEAKIAWKGTKATVMADDLLGEIFNNLIGNSVKFGGPDVQIEICAREMDGQVEVTVADNGPGIPDDQKPGIFTRFGKGMNKRSGKGLGLFISRMLVERYGGRIWAENRVAGSPEKGVAIKFTLQKFTPSAA